MVKKANKTYKPLSGFYVTLADERKTCAFRVKQRRSKRKKIATIETFSFNSHVSSMYSLAVPETGND